jgi:hypothetical protein
MNKKQEKDLAVLKEDCKQILGHEKFVYELTMVNGNDEFYRNHPFTQKLFQKVLNYTEMVSLKDHWHEIDSQIRQTVIEPVLEACVQFEQDQRQ